MESQHSHRDTLFLLFSTLLCLSLSASATRPSPVTHPSALVISACKTTLYPSVCEEMLSTYSPSSTSTPVGQALAGLDAALHHARTAQAFVGSLSSSSGAKTPVRSREGAGAAKDCVETMADGVDRIRKSIQEMGRLQGQDYAFHMSNAQTWVSAALTDENTCMEGFAGAGDADAPVKAEVRKRIVRVARVTSNALALVNRVATGRRH